MADPSATMMRAAFRATVQQLGRRVHVTIAQVSQSSAHITRSLESELKPHKSRRRVVAMVSDAVLPYHKGGKELRYQELLKRLAVQADVHMYTMKWWSGPREHIQDGVTY